MKNSNPILLIEDNETEASAIKKALKAIGVKNKVLHFRNAVNAMDHLLIGDNENPSVILLDLHKPIMGGIEFLQERIKHEDLRALPVVVLSASKAERDKMESYRLNICAYMMKPIDQTQFVNVIKAIDLYWRINQAF
ncbi:MAG: response regulator [Cyclobacteriaceae bacterium]